MTRLSATRLKTYLTCPRQFKYAYVEAIPVPLSAALAFGRVMHRTLYTLHQECIAGSRALDVERAFALFDGLWREAIEQEQPVFKEGGVTVEAYWDIADDMLRGYVARHQSAPQPLMVEYPFELSWEGHLLSGIIDRIDEGESGLVIVDYKTSQRKPSSQVLKEDLQLTVYAFAVERIFGRPVQRIVHYHLRDGTLLATTRSHHDYRRLTQGVLPRFTHQTQRSSYEPRYGYWCRFCDYRARCEQEGRPLPSPQTPADATAEATGSDGTAPPPPS